jgi:hypothetical protein
VIPLPHVSNLYIVETGNSESANHIGLVNGKNVNAPQLGDTGACIYYTTFTSKHDPSENAWFESNGATKFKATDIATAELILESYTY